MQLPPHFYKISGTEPGPNVVIMGGVHGDEQVGLEIIKRFLNLFDLPKDFNSSERKIFERNIKGNLFLGIGNPKSVQLNKRGVSNTDLNRCFSKRKLNNIKEFDSYDQNRARELAPLLEKTDYLIDLHSTSSPSEPFICFQSNSFLHKKLYNLTSVNYILTDSSSPSILSKPEDISELGTTDYYVNKFGGSGYLKEKYDYQGGVGLCYETGQFSDFSKVEQVFSDLLNMLLEINIIDSSFLEEVEVSSSKQENKEQSVYQLVHCEQTESVNFQYKKNMNQGWQKVKQGQVIGKYTDLDKEVYSPESGILLFPLKTDKIRYKGDGLFYIAQKVN